MSRVRSFARGLFQSLLLIISSHAGYEETAKRMYPLILAGILTLCTLISAPSGLFARTRPDQTRTEHHHCDLRVPSILTSDDKMTTVMWIESEAAFRLVYELVLPYILPLVLLGKTQLFTVRARTLCYQSCFRLRRNTHW